MLIIDENMYRLAKMQEKLLKVSNTNQEENLNKYREIVSQIDTKAYSDILEEIKHINEHKQSLETELAFLEKIKKAYDQLLELQLSFKNICYTHGNIDLKLSNLSRLNINYIEDRMNAISGYLINIKNIESNKKRIQELNEQLINEEKKKELLDSRISSLEETLKYNFINAEGRFIANEQSTQLNSQPISVISEYQKINLDFEDLLKNRNSLEIQLKKAEQEKVEIDDTLKATQFCYNQTPNQVNKQILDTTNIDSIKIKYRLIMLKILDLLSTNCQSYQETKNKREKLQELIDARIICLKNLGIHILVDPFARTKIKEQLDSLSPTLDNTKLISDIRKEIAELTSRTEEMTNQNNNYLITLSNIQDLIEDSIAFGDIDITMVELPAEPKNPKEIAPNQVTQIKEVDATFNMSIVIQKTQSVITRVNQMLNTKKKQKTKSNNTYTPDLVIIPNKTKLVESNFENTFTPIVSEPAISKELVSVSKESNVFAFDNELVDFATESGNGNTPTDFTKVESIELPQPLKDITPTENYIAKATETNEGLFETITPFEAPTMFNDRADETVLIQVQEPIEFPTPAVTEEPKFVETPKIDEMLSESFWPTQEMDTQIDKKEQDATILSFDEQINILMAPENNNNNGKVLKKVA